MLLKATELQGHQLEARDGAIGRIKDLYFDDESWAIRYLVADTGRWLPRRRVLLSPLAAVPGAVEETKLPVNLTKAQIENSPAAEDHQPVSEQHQLDLHTYYGWPPYWGVGPYPMAGMVPPVVTSPAGEPAESDRAGRRGGDPHLRSVSHVRGYKIQAIDGDIGHVEDFLVDAKDWMIRLIVVDTRNWLPERKVIVTPAMVDRISWTESGVAVQSTRDAIKASPEYNSDQPLDRDYEQQLTAYYSEVSAHR